MAELKVQVFVDRAGADRSLADLERKLKLLEQSPIKIKIEAPNLGSVTNKTESLATAQGKLQAAFNNTSTSAAQASAATTKLAADQAQAIQAARSLAAAQNEVAKGSTKIKDTFTQNGSAAGQSARGVAQLETAYNRLGVTVANFAKYKLFSAITSGISDSIGEMRKLDDELVTIRKVADATEAELSAISERSYEVGGKYGKAPSDYAAGVAEFSRAGYRETAEALAELSIKAQLVGDMNAETANQFLIATDAAYGYKGSITQLSAVLDGMNAIDNNFATSIEKISAGLGKVAPIASQAHVGVDELAAAIGTITAVTQRSGEEAATALRALFLNIMGDTKTEIEDGATWTAGEIDGLRDILERYAPAAVRAAEATGQVINPMEAMRGLAQSMREGLLSEQELMQMVTDVGGKLRSSQLLAIVQNWDMYESMLSEYQNAAGSADQEVSKMLDSWSVKAEQLKTSFTKMLSGLFDSSMAKGGLDTLRSIVEMLDSDVGRAAIQMAVLGAAAAGAATAVQALGNAMAFFSTKAGKVALVVAAFSALASVVDAITPSYDKLAQKADEAQRAYEAEAAKLADVNQEIKNNTDRIAELEGMGTLTYVEEAELERLREVTKELQAQKTLYEENARAAAQSAAQAAMDAIEKINDPFNAGAFQMTDWEGNQFWSEDAFITAMTALEEQSSSLPQMIGLYNLLADSEISAALGAEYAAESQDTLRRYMASSAAEYQKHIDTLQQYYDTYIAAKPESTWSDGDKAIADALAEAKNDVAEYLALVDQMQKAETSAASAAASNASSQRAEQLRESAAAYKEAANEYYQGLKEEQQSWEELVDSEGAYDYGHVETLNRLNGELEAYEKAQKAINDLVKSNASDDDLHALVDTLWAADERLGSDAADSLLHYAFGVRDAAKAIDEANAAAEASVEIFNSTDAGEKVLDQAASDAVTEEPVAPPAPPAEEYQNLADAITAAKDSYMTLLEAQKEVAATGLITEGTFKALEDAGYKFSEVLKDDVSGGLWVSADELKKFTNETEDRLNDLTGAELDWDAEATKIPTGGVDAFTAALQAAQKELSELEKMLKEMGESGDAFRGYSDAYKDVLKLGEEGRTGTNEFALKARLLVNEETKAELGNDAEKWVEFFQGEVQKNLLSGEMDGTELIEYIFGKGFKGTEKAFVKMGDSIGVFLDKIDWKQWSQETGIAEDALKSLLGYADEYDTRMKDVGDTTQEAADKVGKLGDAGADAQNGLKKIKVVDVIKEGAKAGKSVEEITKQIEELQKQAEEGEIELEGDTSELEKQIDKAIKEVEDVTNDGDYTVTVDGDVDEALAAIEMLETEVRTLCETPWVMTVTIQTVGSLPRTSGLLAGGSTSAAGGGVAKADGGKARASGTTLVGEIDPEIIVDRSAGMWRLAAYPQLTSLDTGDIVFNGEQTRNILAGQPTDFSRNVIGGRSYASGTSTITTTWADGTTTSVSAPDYVVQMIQSGTGHVGSTTKSAVPDIIVTPSSKPSGSGGRGSSGGGGSRSKKDDAEPIDVVEEWFDYFMEKMDIAIDALSYKLDQLDYELEGIIHPLEETIEDYERLSEEIDRQIELLERQREAMIDPIQDEIDALEKAKEIEDEQLELAEKKQAVEEARAELQNAQNERNIRYFNAEKGQWEWMADQSRVADAEETVKDAEKDLADFEYEMYIRSLEREIEAIESVFDDKIEELEKEQMAYDDAVYDLEQKVDLITDNYEDRMYPIEREQGALELKKQGMELEWANAIYPYHEPEDSLSKYLDKLDGTDAEKKAIADALSKAESMSSSSYNGVESIYYDKTGSAGSDNGGYTKVTTPKTTEQMYNQLLSEMGVRFGASESSSTGIVNVTTTSSATVVDNSGQTIINGITIEGDVESMTLADMLDDAGIHVQRKSR